MSVGESDVDIIRSPLEPDLKLLDGKAKTYPSALDEGRMYGQIGRKARMLVLMIRRSEVKRIVINGCRDLLGGAKIWSIIRFTQLVPVD